MMYDVLVFSSVPDEHWDKLKKVLGKISASGMTAKKEKHKFAGSEVQFMGHIVSPAGIKLDPTR